MVDARAPARAPRSIAINVLEARVRGGRILNGPTSQAGWLAAAADPLRRPVGGSRGPRRHKGRVELLTIQDIARNLGVSTRTVVGYIRRGELRALEGVGRGHGYRVRREWVDAFLHSRELDVPAPTTPSPRGTVPRERREAPTRPTTFTSVRDARAGLGLVRGGRSS
jgi:excisionase family DNA binding protein